MADDTAHASVLALRVVDYATRPVAAQASARERLEAVILRALAGTPEVDRVVLDTADGAAVVFLGGAGQALAAADAVRGAAAGKDLPLALGLNAGPVKPVTENGRTNVIGDGIAAALAAAGFAAAGEALASRDFRDAAGSPFADRFAAAGTRTDASLRLHELHACTPAPDPRRAGRRRALRIAAVTGAALLAGGAAVRVTRDAVARRGRPARVALAITPWAEVTVDGVAQGRTPPLKTLELAPGRRTIALRHGSAPPLTLELDLKPGEETTIRHSFTAPAPRQQPQTLRGFLRSLGL
jgi:hypothetical protein